MDAAASEPEVDEAWASEAERRWKEIESGEVETVPWDEVRANLLNPRSPKLTPS
jgi:putative addiction module component (TIGR02574 family)